MHIMEKEINKMNLERVIVVRTSKTVYRDGDKVVKVLIKNIPKWMF